MSSAPPNWVFSMFAFISFCLCMIPMRWHFRAWNVGTVLYMVWVGIANLIYFINSIVWRNHYKDITPGWCYFSSRLAYASSWGAIVASLIINRRLYHISTVSVVTTSPAERRRQIAVDLGLGIGLPIIGVIFQYINSPNRYDIPEEIGCLTVSRITPVYIVLTAIPPIIISLISAVYCGLSIHSFNKRRAQFKEILSANPGLTSNRYFRIMGLAGVELLFNTPLLLWRLVSVVKAGLEPWISWDNIHNHYSDVDAYSARFWRNSPSEANLEFGRWSFVIGAFIFFAFFGFAEEARKNYGVAIDSMLKLVGQTRSTLIGSRFTNSTTSESKSNMGSMGKTATIPVFIRKETHSKRDSFDTLSDSDLASIDEKQVVSGNTSIQTLDRSSSPIPIPDLPDFQTEKPPQANTHNMV